MRIALLALGVLVVSAAAPMVLGEYRELPGPRVHFETGPDAAPSAFVRAFAIRPDGLSFSAHLFASRGMEMRIDELARLHNDDATAATVTFGSDVDLVVLADGAPAGTLVLPPRGSVGVGGVLTLAETANAETVISREISVSVTR